MEYLSSCDSWRVLWSWKSTSNKSTSIWLKKNAASCQQSWHQTHPDCFLCLSLSFALAFPSASVLNNLRVFLVIVCDNTFEDVRYRMSHTRNFDVSGVYICECMYMYMYSSTAETCLHHAWMCWWGTMVGLGEKPKHFNIRKGARLAWLPLLPAGSWVLNSRYLWGFLSITFTQRSSITNSCFSRFQVTPIHMKTHSESCILVFSPVSVVFGRQVQVVYLYDSIARAVCDTLWCQCLAVINFLKIPFICWWF